MRMKTVKKFNLIRKCLILAVINFIFLLGILSEEGIIIHRDFNFPVFRENFIRYHYPLWNDILSQPNIEHLVRLPIRLPFLFLIHLGIPVSIILKLMIYFAYLLSSISMYLYISEILQREKMREHFALLGSLIFAYSLPLLQFMGGISLVYSIGILPFILWLLHNYLKDRSSRWIILLSFSFLLALGHPFVFILNLGIFLVYPLLFIDSFISYFKLILLTVTLFLLLFQWFLLPYLQILIS